MIRSYAITITEIDDIEEAVGEAREQLSRIPLLKHTVGIVTTHPEFVFSGVYGAVTKILPFPTVGTTTVSQSVCGQTDTYLCSIFILTSHDCEFSCGFSEAIPKDGDVGELTKECYVNLRERLNGDNKLTLLYVPMMTTHYSYQYISALNSVDERIPVFGMVANDDKDGSIYDNNSRTLMNGELYDDRLVMLLISGNVSPKFYIGSLTEESIIVSRIGEVTSSTDNRLLEVNNMNVVEFLENEGSKMGRIGNSGIISTTFLLDLSEDGVLISRTPLLVEEDHIVCAGNVPLNAVLSIASSTFDVVAKTAKNVMEEIVRNHTNGTVLIYSCIGRRTALLGNPMMEYEIFQDALSKDFNYLAAYASGEICPTSVTASKSNNHEHNQTLVVCVLD